MIISGSYHHGLGGGLGINTLHQIHIINHLLANLGVGVKEKRSLHIIAYPNDYNHDHDLLGNLLGDHNILICQQRDIVRDTFENDVLVLAVNSLGENGILALQILTESAVEGNEEIVGNNLNIERL